MAGETIFSKKEEGGVLVEFSFVLPLMFIFIFGLFELSRALNEVSWVVQSAYQSAKIGAETPREFSETAMNQRHQLMSGLLNNFLDDIQMTPDFDVEDGLVSSAIGAKLRAIGNTFPINLSFQMTASNLLRNAGSGGDMNEFQNPSSPLFPCTTCVSYDPHPDADADDRIITDDTNLDQIINEEGP